MDSLIYAKNKEEAVKRFNLLVEEEEIKNPEKEGFLKDEKGYFSTSDPGTYTEESLFNLAKEKGDFDAENNILVKNIETLLAPYNISFGNRILKQIEDFVNIYKECFVNDDVESEAIEKILLSKVVSKLEVKTIEDKEKLVMEFEKLNLYQCADFIKHLDED